MANSISDIPELRALANRDQVIRLPDQVDVPVTSRLDTAEEVSIYEAGGVLQRFAQDFLESAAVA